MNIFDQQQYGGASSNKIITALSNIQLHLSRTKWSYLHF